MRYRIVTDRSPAENPKRPVVPRMPESMRPLPRPIRTGMFAALDWPGTARDVQWSSTPHVGRSPAGWASQGFTR